MNSTAVQPGRFLPALDDSLPRRTALILLLCIILIGAAVRVYAFRGFYGLDDGDYMLLAHCVTADTPACATYAGPAVFPMRVGLTLPTAAAFKAFGVREWPTMLYPFLISLGAIALAYVCASVLFDRRAGLIAAALSGMMTWQIEAATSLLPDLPATFFSAVSIALILIGLRRNWTEPGKLLGIGILAGLAFGASWLCKESVVYSVPFYAVVMAFSARMNGPRVLWLWVGVAAGALAVFAGETLVYWQATGDLLFRFHETERNYTQNAKYFFSAGSRYGWQNGQSFEDAVAKRLFVTGPSMIFLNRQALYLSLVAVAASVYAIVRRERSFLIPLLWFWTLALMFNFASSSLAAYRPLVLFHRYLLPVFFPATIVAGGLLAALLWPRDRVSRVNAPRFFRTAGCVLAAALLWVGMSETYWAMKYRPTEWAAEVRTLAGTVRGDKPVVTDSLSLRGLEYFAGYPTTTAWKDFEQIRGVQDIPPGSMVIVNKRYLRWLQANGGLWGSRDSGYAAHEFYTKAPGSWSVVWTNNNATVYRVNQESRIR